MSTFYNQIMKEVNDENVEQVFLDDLVLFRYTQKCHRGRNWNAVNIRCRGLIMDGNSHKIVGRPFDKFFNLDEPGLHRNARDYVRVISQHLTCWAAEKVDGTMITIFFNDGWWQCATHRQLSGPHVDAANKYLEKQKFPFKKGYTYVCEFIAPWDRKLVNYGDETKMVLLTVQHNDWSSSLCAPEELKLIANKIGIDIPKEVCIHEDVTRLKTRPLTEGYVLKFEDNSMIKCKTKWYKEAHKFRQETPAREVLRIAREGIGDDFLKAFTLERRKEIEDEIAKIQRLKENIELEISSVWKIVQLARQSDSNKDTAALIIRYNNWLCPSLFAHMRGKTDQLEHLLWKEVTRRYMDE